MLNNTRSSNQLLVYLPRYLALQLCATAPTHFLITLLMGDGETTEGWAAAFGLFFSGVAHQQKVQYAHSAADSHQFVETPGLCKL